MTKCCVITKAINILLLVLLSQTIMAQLYNNLTKEEARVIRTKHAGWSGICFGDSGGPLYAVLGGGLDSVQVAGITSTTMSQDCLIGSTHVKLSAPVHKTWIGDNVR